ncbi:MAG: hypothetical protein JHC37_04195 [Campylobacteraceae bacterium]|jgi:hypothetical protein|nr:hypothetical protein [Campylobacteraceae bacterium]
MKKVILSSIIALVTATCSFASAEAKEVKAAAGEVEKKGVLATEWCIKKGYFKDCRLDSTVDSPLALFVHSEGVTYKLDTAGVALHELDEGIGRNNVTVIGTLEKDNVIKVRAYKAPPPEGKSFFKGCL